MNVRKFFIKSNGLKDFTVLEYDPDIHLRFAQKFLFYNLCDERILIVGDLDINTHMELFFITMVLLNRKLPEEPAGAGNIKNNEIVSWISGGFGMFTPANIRSDLEVLIGVEKSN